MKEHTVILALFCINHFEPDQRRAKIFAIISSSTKTTTGNTSAVSLVFVGYSKKTAPLVSACAMMTKKMVIMWKKLIQADLQNEQD